MNQKKTQLARVVIARNAYRWQYGGAEQFAYNLALVLKQAGIESTIVSRVPELLAHCRRNGIKTFRNIWYENRTRRRWMPIYYASYPVLVTQYAWILWRTKADLYIATSRDDQVFGTLAAKIVGVPVVWFDHADMKYITGNRFHLLSKSYYWALHHADRVIMTSRAEHEKVSRHVPAELQSNFVTINNGAMVREGIALDRPVGAKIVAYTGRLDKDKGIFDLAEAAVKVVKAVPEAQFWLAGKGPYEGELKAKLEKLEIVDRFRFLGHLDNVRSLLLAADVFVYPTHHDAAPLAPVEAILAGVPVVASNVGGIPEMVPSEAGILTPVRDPDKLAESIVRVLTDIDLMRRLREGAKEASKTRTFSYVLNHDYLPLFRKVVEEHS